METQCANEKECRNCKYFKQHYLKYNNTIKKTNCGWCLHTTKLRRKHSLNHCKTQMYHYCELWEENQINDEENKKTLKKAIVSISKQLEDLVLLLKEDLDEDLDDA